jgi:hypothetical protein
MAPGEAMEQRAYNIRLLLVLGFLLTPPPLAAAAPCYDLSKGQPAGLTGVLDYVVFASPPNYKNVQKGDTPEPSFVLRLAHPICIQGDTSADPKTSFRAVQLVKTAKVEGKLKPLLHQHVTVTLKNPAPDTMHRQAPLFAWVAGIAPTLHQMAFTRKRVPASTAHHMDIAAAHGTPPTTHQVKFAKEHGTAAKEFTRKRVPAFTAHHMEAAKAHGTATTAHPMEATREHGTAAATVRAFYAGLADGRGDIASAMVVPQKRAHGPFSADELSHFYGHLKKPIRLRSVEANGPSEFMVQYRYAASARDCNGRAVIKTVMLSGRTFIKSIDALDRC